MLVLISSHDYGSWLHLKALFHLWQACSSTYTQYMEAERQLLLAQKQVAHMHVVQVLGRLPVRTSARASLYALHNI